MALSDSNISLQDFEEPAEAKNRIVIGFVNNMPDAAIRSSERQFRAMLQAEARDVEVVFRGFSCRAIPRSDIARTTFLKPYCDVDGLWNSPIDGLIVTGTEPRADKLTNELCWPLLSRLTDWAEQNTISTIWSCLAAHAAVFRLSEVARRPLPKKMSGLFECSLARDHPLTVGLPQSWLNPHSRCNDLPEAELLEKGFEPLATLSVGLDTFILQKKSLFVFFQGHPEYDPESLLLEYIRDVKRYIEGQRETYPDPPVGYFDQQTSEQLEELRQQAFQKRDVESLNAVTRLIQGYKVENAWRTPAMTFYRNWLNYLANEKAKREGQRSAIFN